ncbi:MAG: BlaI/MecI/CopY family transcriptional regulator [Thalassovita sp.]
MVRQKKTGEFLTEVELEFMNVVWATGGGTVREILAELNKTHERAYTSVATVLKIMEKKGFLVSDRQDRSLVYHPAVQKTAYQKTTLRNLSSKLFNDTPAALVARLVEDEDVTNEMLEEIKALLDERLGEENGSR